MYSNINRTDDYIDSLVEFIKREYGISVQHISKAKRGYYGETWRIGAPDASYFVKLVYPAIHAAVYERSFPIIQHICNHGIDFISKIVKTKGGGLFSRFGGAALGVFDWIDGENIENDGTKIPEYQMLAKIYTVPADGLAIAKEDFSGGIADRFYKQLSELKDSRIRSLIDKNRLKIEHRAARLEYFANLCNNRKAELDFNSSDHAQYNDDIYVITHGDAGGNLLKNGDKYFLVDWDYPVLAPPERDAWFMCSRDWARDAFHNALRQNGIDYVLRRERLAYYCYYFFFFYLAAYLDGYTQGDTFSDIEEYIDGWIEDSIAYADNI